ncbi:hypothetical protein KF707_12240 [Candidatus Obscuribacterales bacterium]|nr:hypothetical protein [Candidatus Obscuribacterales bacterium]MBX3137002.1 hypothetical protein [Candidatus Obscuribacterales bacterium]MBX3153256.1 hypothetical protein [Candidatus Obscuribacterales bacterium]
MQSRLEAILMSMVRVYLYAVGQKVILPLVAENEAGVYVETGPVQFFDVPEVDKWKAEVYRRLVDGNPVVTTPDEDVTPGSPILEALNLKRWDDFERQSVLFTIHAKPRCVSLYVTGKDKDGRWTQNGKEREFASDAPLETVIDEMANELIQQPGAVAKPTLLLGGG